MSYLQTVGHPHGVVYMAAKKHYFGVGGGSRRFISVVEKDGEFGLFAWVIESGTNTVHGCFMSRLC